MFGADTKKSVYQKELLKKRVVNQKELLIPKRASMFLLSVENVILSATYRNLKIISLGPRPSPCGVGAFEI